MERINRAKNRKYHYIYKITRFDGKYYIGMHSTDKMEDNYFGSGQRISRSIKKYGQNRHVKEILEFLSSREELAKREKELVCKELLLDSLCMNIALGGTGGWANNPNSIKAMHTPEARKLSKERSQARLAELRLDPDWKKQNSQRLSDAAKGKQPWLGRNHSEETKEKLKTTMIGLQSGEKNSQFGTRWIHSLELKVSKRILKEEPLLDGFKEGRKLKF